MYVSVACLVQSVFGAMRVCVGVRVGVGVCVVHLCIWVCMHARVCLFVCVRLFVCAPCVYVCGAQRLNPACVPL